MANLYTVNLVLEPWLRDLLVDPISKSSFVETNEKKFVAPCGFVYGYTNDVPDFRVRLSIGAQKWLLTQAKFEKWIDKYFDRGESNPNYYKKEQELDKPVYDNLKLLGRVLDIGGLLGFIRKYMNLNQEYVSVDPFISVHLNAINRKNLFSYYPLSSPLNFIGGFAEFLPFKTASFDTVNMRSCLDHFYNPEIALLEAYRVLRANGRLIVGISIPSRSNKSKIKEMLRPFVSIILPRYKEHHVWHPTYESLMRLCKSCGFDLEKELWQTDDILYASFLRRNKNYFSSESAT